jgi:hypothetical protein
VADFRPCPAGIVNSDFSNLVKVVVYLVLGTLGIGLLGAWVLKRFGPPRK